MKRIILSLSLIIAVAATAMAVPARPGQWKTILLADGTQVRVELKGDEYCHYWQSEDGQLFMNDYSNNSYELVSRSTISQRAREARERMQAMPLSSEQTSGPKKITMGGDHKPYIGKKKCLCILVEFQDVKFQSAHTLDMYKEYINGQNYTNPELGKVQTVHEYFKEQSLGQFEIDFDVVGPYTMPQKASYYGANQTYYGQTYNDLKVQDMIVSALQQANPEVNYADYDWDGDGYSEAIFVLYAGLGEADGGTADDIWPHKGQVSNRKYDNIYVSDYACSSELRHGSILAGIGTMCHEYSHCLGFPDLYDTEYDGTTGMGKWDVMDSGCYNPDNKSTNPSGYSGYERWYAGWLTPVELNDEAVKVENLKPLTSGGLPYIIYNQGKKDEYYMLECRKREGTDAGLLNDGLLIYHIDYDAVAWMYNIVNSPTKSPYMSNHPRYQLVGSDGTFGANAIYPSVSTVLTNNSTPAATVYNTNTDGSLFLNRTVMNIKKNADGTVSFDYLPEPLLPTEKPEGALFYESFDLNYSTGGNDAEFTPTQTMAVVTDNDGWTFQSGAGYSAARCGFFGKSSLRGIAKTPNIDFNGSYLLTFKAAPYGSESTSVQITATGVTIGTKSFPMTRGQWTDCSTEITATGAKAITFASNAKRFFLDEVLIMPLDVDGIQSVTADVDKNAAVYNLAGQRVDANHKGIVIIGGRKVLNK